MLSQYLHSSILDDRVPVEVPAVIGHNPLDFIRLHALNIGGEKKNENIFLNLLKKVEQGIKASFSSPNHCVTFPWTLNLCEPVDRYKVDRRVHLIVGWVGRGHLS